MTDITTYYDARRKYYWSRERLFALATMDNPFPQGCKYRLWGEVLKEAATSNVCARGDGPDRGKDDALRSEHAFERMFAEQKEYCVVDLRGKEGKLDVTYLDAPPEHGWGVEHRTEKLVLRRIPAGSFLYQGHLEQGGLKIDFSQPFYIGIYEVTRAQFSRIMGYVPGDMDDASTFGERIPGICVDRPMEPVAEISWDEIRGTTNITYGVEGTSRLDEAVLCDWPHQRAVGATSFCGILSRLTGRSFDLPTEVEWEYVCKSGTGNLRQYEEEWKVHRSPFCQVDAIAMHDVNAEWKAFHPWAAPRKVGIQPPNAWGVYDMYGNVAEWCRDCYRPNVNVPGEVTSDRARPLVGDEVKSRVVRGGDNFKLVPAEFRRGCPQDLPLDPLIGFRVVMSWYGQSRP